MKNLFLSILLATILFSCGPQRPSVIEKPVFETWSGKTIEINKIETSDSATILHLDAFFRPGWWIRIAGDSYIRESGTDNKLLLVKAEGIKIDEEHWMPESGESSFKLYFPPLDPNVTKIDFIESDCESCFKIWGISLLPESKIETISKSTFTPKSNDVPLPDPTFSDQPAKISGKLHGFNKAMMPYEVTFYTSDLISGDHQDTKLVVEEDGTFKGDIPINTASIVYTDKLSSLFLEPGKEITIDADLRMKTRFESRYRTDKQPEDSIYVFTTGSSITPAQLAEINNKIETLFDQDVFMNEIAGMSPDDYKKYLLDKWQGANEQIETLNMSAPQKKLLSIVTKSKYLHHIMFYYNYLMQAHMTANNIPMEKWRETDFQIENPGPDYYSFINNMVNDELSYDGEFLNVVRGINYLPMLQGVLYENQGIEKVTAVSDKLTGILNKKSDLIIEITKAQILYEELQQLNFFTEDQKQQLNSVFANNTFSKELIKENDELQRIIEANKEASGDGFVIHEIPETSEDKLFETILAEHKGKTIVVDFWATWCGPCLGAMKQIKPLKEEMKDEDVVFVYLTGETSPTGTWNKMVPDIHGHHYRVNDAQWQYWYENLKIEGVPTFMIFNKDGKQVARHTGFPGVDAMREAITKG